jgi:predicted Fe-Mo cluster-binding NifX family protein
MKYAVPVCDGKLFNHYSKAPQFLVIDDTSKQSIYVDIEQQSSTGSCGKKSKINALLQKHHVNAVVVKNIGESMLASLFQHGIKVFTTVRGMDINNLDFDALVPVEDMSYARPSLNKKHKDHKCCQHRHGHHHGRRETALSPARNRLGIKALSKLQRIHKFQ